LIRHGAVAGDGLKRYNGSRDVPMSERGIAQVEAASSFVARQVGAAGRSQDASYLRDVHGKAESPPAGSGPGLSAVYCSDLGRAVQSAGIVARPYGLAPVIVPALRERSFGIWEGMTFTEIREQYPEEFEAWAADPVGHSPVGGESTTEVCKRVIPAMEEIVGRHQGQAYAVVAHGGVNRIILCHILAVPLSNIFRIEQDHAAVNIIEFWDRYPVLKLMNGGPKEI
jgi:broad specificity phosphatase PhoE